MSPPTLRTSATFALPPEEVSARTPVTSPEVSPVPSASNEIAPLFPGWSVTVLPFTKEIRGARSPEIFAVTESAAPPVLKIEIETG